LGEGASLWGPWFESEGAINKAVNSNITPSKLSLLQHRDCSSASSMEICIDSGDYVEQAGDASMF
jgi:hypothetical protein